MTEIRIQPKAGSSLQRHYGNSFPSYENVVYHGLVDGGHEYVIVYINDDKVVVKKINYDEIEGVMEYPQGFPIR